MNFAHSAAVSVRRYCYITTPIFYPNGQLHFGHLYTMIIADSCYRYQKTRQVIVYLQTGSDEFGEKIVRQAASSNLTPAALVERNVQLFQKLWKLLRISQHFFYRTSASEHADKVQKIFQSLQGQGDIYQGKYAGYYCLVCEDYLTNRAQDRNCPNCYRATEWVEQRAYFLNVGKYLKQLREFFQTDFLEPKQLKQELINNFLSQDVRDLCLTRQNLDWGVKVPGEDNMVIYVWFDALCNYLNSEQGTNFFFTNCPEFEIIQIIGKDIARFHSIYWIIILLALKARLPNKILAHGWIINKEQKMSKSLGNVIDPLLLLQKYPADLLRAYVL